MRVLQLSRRTTDITEAAEKITESRSEDQIRHNNRLNLPEELTIDDWVLLHDGKLDVARNAKLKAKSMGL